MFASLLGFAPLHRRYGSVRLWRVTAMIFTVIYPVFSALPWIAAKTDVSVVLWVIMPPLIVTRYASMVISLASVQILFNDLCVPSERAFINGLGQSVGSLARAIGPTLGGMCWSWSVSNGLPAPMDYHFTVSQFHVLRNLHFWRPTDSSLSFFCWPPLAWLSTCPRGVFHPMRHAVASKPVEPNVSDPRVNGS